tara:strand:- start:32407 stop:33165 length:759 start_codon:yes stop_codon:yes gene_type:complete
MSLKIMTKTCSHKTIGSKQIELYKYRSQKVRLKWCKNVCDIIVNFNIKKINDLGCNYFQLFKEIYLRKLKLDYFGYDLDEEFIKIGLNYLSKIKKVHNYKNNLVGKSIKFKEGKSGKKIKLKKLSFNYKISNIEKKNSLRICDCTVLSAVLEHTDYPNRVLRNVFKTTKKLIILRTFIDTKSQNRIQTKNVKNPYNINRFSFDLMKKQFKKNGFKLYFLLDEATNFSHKKFFVNGNFKSERKFYIAIGIKKP